MAQIALRTAAVLASFRRILDATARLLSSPHVNSIDIIESAADNEARFMLWASNIGAHHIDHKSSLDHRVREAPDVAQRIIRLLDEVVVAQDDLYAILSGARADASEQLEENSSNDDVDDVDDIYTGDAQGELPATEAQAICLDVRNVLSHLMKFTVPLRRVTDVDRYARAAADPDPISPHFDIAHIGHKFPKASPWLREALGRANAQRRHYLRYERRHDLRGRQRLDPALVRLAHASLGLPKALTLPSGDVLTKESAYFSTKKHYPASTLDDIDDTMTEATSVTSSATGSTAAGDLTIPELSSFAKPGRSFECPYCWQMIFTERERMWR